MTLSNPKLTYWQEQEASINGMLLNPDAQEIDCHERVQILEFLPELHGQSILELGAGIGRYTTHFASVASQVIAVDFNQSFIDKNKAINKKFKNIDYRCANVLDLDFESASFDFIFINWLFMYLEDAEVETLSRRIHHWLTSSGQLFFRESCITDSKGNIPKQDSSVHSNHSHSHYRNPDFYLALFQKTFRLERQGNVLVYEQKYNNPNQFFCLLQKKTS